jgi:hypothetical protein
VRVDTFKIIDQMAIDLLAVIFAVFLIVKSTVNSQRLGELSEVPLIFLKIN